MISRQKCVKKQTSEGRVITDICRRWIVTRELLAVSVRLLITSLKSGSEVLVPMDMLETPNGNADDRDRLDGSSEGDLALDMGILDPMKWYCGLG